MKININVVYGFLALIFGLNFAAQAKTEFQTKLEKHIQVEVKDKDVQPVCGGVCGGGNGK